MLSDAVKFLINIPINDNDVWIAIDLFQWKLEMMISIGVFSAVIAFIVRIIEELGG
jgi:hypothetical protein